ncbi:AAA family ATPase [Vibrio rotiferianus]|uniref:AAA family ATPase n=1 Tax=Vibrio rotiferianus TaxID=190895 RepID=UPI001110D13F|nr:ATP-binding protein [Vibrio rotiferianus]TMX73102.1 hypothetical protein DA097_00870 [Vibrio rotiferianus]
MQASSLFSNYFSDLQRAQTECLLLELSQSDVAHFSDSQGHSAIPLVIARKWYDRELVGNQTNVLVLNGQDADQDDRFMLLETIMVLLEDELKSLCNVAIFKESIKAGVSALSGGMMDQYAGQFLDQGADFIFSGMSDLLGQKICTVVSDNIALDEFMASQLESSLQDLTGESLGSLIGHCLSQDKLYLSPQSKQEVSLLIETFSQVGQTNVFQLAFKLIYAISVGASKLIYVNNPHYLDANSQALLSLILSYAKYQKAKGQHNGISIVYHYSDQSYQPYQPVVLNEQNHNWFERLSYLEDQRRFAQRYGMLERPSSDAPAVTVKSHLFLGREQELNTLLIGFHQRSIKPLSLVIGEAGVGKTALVHAHLHQLIQTCPIVSLSLVNEVGHYSLNAGLSSLEKSIMIEASRLELQASWSRKAQRFIKGIGNKESAVKVIGALFNQADKLINIGMAINDRLMLDQRVAQVTDQNFLSLDNLSKEAQKEQFERLDTAINKLLEINDDSRPIVLFIDDLQWIDDASADYIVQRLIAQRDIHIVATVRGSDAATLLKSDLSTKLSHISTRELLTCAVGQGSSKISTRQLYLKGLTKDLLSAVLNEVIEGEYGAIQCLGNKIFQLLGGESQQEINTLFAIETINILCDPKLYAQTQQAPLILHHPTRFNSEVTDVVQAVDDTFDYIHTKHQSSLRSPSSTDAGQHFTLTAYAVLEERLLLLKQYFNEYGDAAVNTLLFSTLLEEPFDSDVVNEVIVHITASNDTTISALTEHLRANTVSQPSTLKPEHYAVIEQVYEILRRYPKDKGDLTQHNISANHDRYQYSYSLLNIFFQQLLKQRIEHLFEKNFPIATHRLFILIMEAINQRLGELPTHQPELFDSRATDQMNERRLFEIWLKFNEIATKVAKSAIDYLTPQSSNNTDLSKEQQYWYENYLQIALAQAKKYQVLCRNSSSKSLLAELIRFFESKFGVLEHTHHLSQLYVSLLSSYNQSCIATQDSEAALETARKLYSYANQGYAQQPDQWKLSYFKALIAQCLALQAACQFKKALRKAEQCVELAEKYAKESAQDEHEQWQYCLAQSLTLLADSFYTTRDYGKAMVEVFALSKGEVSESQELLRAEFGLEAQYRANKIIAELYLTDNDKWVDSYIHNLNHLVTQTYNNGCSQQALEAAIKSYQLCKPCYQQHNCRYVETYLTCLNNLANCYYQQGERTVALEFDKERAGILAVEYAQQSEAWFEDYSVCLRNLGQTLVEHQAYQEGCNYLEKRVELYRQYYGELDEGSVEDLVTELYELVEDYEHQDKYMDAFNTQKKLVSYISFLYQNDPQGRQEQYDEERQHLADLIEMYKFE